MGKDLRDILSSTAKIMLVAYVFSLGINKYISNIKKLEDKKLEYSNKIFDETNSPLVTNYYDYKLNKMKNIKDLNYYFKNIDKNVLKESSDFYKKYSGYILPEDMQTVNQNKLDNEFNWENDWNNYCNHKLDPIKTKSFIIKIFNNAMTTSSENYKKEIKNIKTIEDVMSNLFFMKYQDDYITYKKADFMASFKKVHHNRADDCDGGMIYAAGALSDNGFPAYELILRGEKYKNNKKITLNHSLFIYKTDKGNFGTLGINKEDMLYPRYKSIEELVEKINKGMGIDYTEYEIYDLKKQFPNFIDNDKNNDPRYMYTKLRNICED